jgi:hypothetical protein
LADAQCSGLRSPHRRISRAKYKYWTLTSFTLTISDRLLLQCLDQPGITTSIRPNIMSDVVIREVGMPLYLSRDATDSSTQGCERSVDLFEVRVRYIIRRQTTSDSITQALRSIWMASFRRSFDRYSHERRWCLDPGFDTSHRTNQGQA